MIPFEKEWQEANPARFSQFLVPGYRFAEDMIIPLSARQFYRYSCSAFYAGLKYRWAHTKRYVFGIQFLRYGGWSKETGKIVYDQEQC